MRPSGDPGATTKFVGTTSRTEGLPLNMGGEHVGPEDMQRNLWWRIGRHYPVEAQPEEFQDRSTTAACSSLAVTAARDGIRQQTGRRLYSSDRLRRRTAVSPRWTS